jgi:hypothetical protein
VIGNGVILAGRVIAWHPARKGRAGDRADRDPELGRRGWVRLRLPGD